MPSPHYATCVFDLLVVSIFVLYGCVLAQEVILKVTTLLMVS